jgi:hypothetical protein
MGAEEGRAFYWRTPGGSNGSFSSFHQYLGTGQLPQAAPGIPQPVAFSRTPVSARMQGSP